MLQAFRDNLKGTMAIIIVGLMIIPFALFGVDSLFLQDNSAGKAAAVNGSAISELELTRAVRAQKQQLLERFGEQAPADLLSDEQLRGPVLSRLIQRELLVQAAHNGAMAISDTGLDTLIVSAPQFQQDGKFSPELYTQLLRNMGYTPASYKKLLVQDILVNQHASGVSGSAFVTEADIAVLTALTQQQRSFFYLTIPYASVVDSIVLEESELADYYDASTATLMSPEQVSIDYIELSLDDLAAAVDVDPLEVQAQYEQDVASFDASTERQAAHILIESGDAAVDKIAAVKARLDAGDSFEVVAAELSEDLGSRDIGGDLGVTDGATFPEAFETALATLEVGQISAAVETDAGTHFIKLMSEEKASPPTFEEARAAIEESLALAAADGQFVEMLEALPDATYNASSLREAADSLGMDLQSSELFGRRGGVGITANNQVLAVVFGDDVLHEGVASDIIEVSDNHVVVIKLKEHRPTTVKPFESVKAEISERLTRQKAETLLMERSANFITALEEGANIEVLATEQSLDWQVKLAAQRNDVSVDSALLQHIFSLPKPAGKAVATALPLASGDYVVAQLTVVNRGVLPAMDEVQKTALRTRLARELGNTEFSVYQGEQQAEATVDIY